jgi:DNA replication and repair protein RecF
MILSSINLKNIRTHSNTLIRFAKNLNYIVGGNGVGKTTILESIYYLCTTKSCVTSSDIEAVSFGSESFEIRGSFSGTSNDEVQVKYSVTDNKKTYLRNDKQVSRLADVIGKFPVVMLSPRDHSITQGYASERRKFVDSVISQASRTYLNLLIEYNRIIKQKSSLLNRLRETKNDYDELKAWNEKLLQSGIVLIRHRLSFVKDFVSYMKESYIRILGDKETPNVSYRFLEGASEKNLEDDFIQLLEAKKEEEIIRGKNLVGPHRDDFIFDINGTNLKSFGSQGQHKTFQTILKFAEYFYLSDKTGNNPLFLLDDVFGELDAERASAISNYLGSVGQAFITLTDFGNFSFLKTSTRDKVIKLTRPGEVVYA